MLISDDANNYINNVPGGYLYVPLKSINRYSGIKRKNRGGMTASSKGSSIKPLVTDSGQNAMLANVKFSAAEGMRSARIVTSEARAVLN